MPHQSSADRKHEIIELTSLADRELSDLQMAHLEGGSASASSGGCGCACAYRDRGGSSIADNGAANAAQGITSRDESGVWDGGNLPGPTIYP